MLQYDVMASLYEGETTKGTVLDRMFDVAVTEVPCITSLGLVTCVTGWLTVDSVLDPVDV